MEIRILMKSGARSRVGAQSSAEVGSSDPRRAGVCVWKQDTGKE